MTDNTRVNVTIPTESYEKLRVIAFEQRTTIPEIIRQSIDAYIIQAAPKNPQKGIDACLRP